MSDPAPSLVGQGLAFDHLLELARRRELPHAVLFEGPPGTGKTTAASLFAATLLARDPDLVTSRFVDRIARGQHADLHVVSRPADKVDIPLDSIRELQTRLERSALEGGARVVIIDPADRLNPQGQNALLKTLEEPGESTFLLLTASRPESLLETVRSRVRRLRLQSLPDDLLRARVAAPEDCPSALFDRIVEMAEGSSGQLQRLVTGEARAVLGQVEVWLAERAEDPAGLGRAALGGASGREEVEERAAVVLAVLRGLFREGLRNQLAADRRDSYFTARTGGLVGALERVLLAEDDLRLGIPAGQVLDALFVELTSLGLPVGG